jgi:hypothetical protein
MWRFYVGAAVVYATGAALHPTLWVFWGIGSVFAVFAWLHRRRYRRSLVERVSHELEGQSPQSFNTITAQAHVTKGIIN